MKNNDMIKKKNEKNAEIRGKKWQNLYGNIYLPKKHQICLKQKDFFFFFFFKKKKKIILAFVKTTEI